MMILPMASGDPNESPAIFFDQLDDFPNFLSWHSDVTKSINLFQSCPVGYVLQETRQHWQALIPQRRGDNHALGF